MFDVVTGWKISVESAGTDGSYVIVPAQQVDALCRVFTEHRIPYAIQGEVPSRHHAEAPSELVVRVGLAFEMTLVQEILDLAP